MKVGFISLGCSKNLVDTEMAIGVFKEQGYGICNRPEEADILVINTCGFIEPAKEEAINTILEMAAYKEQNCKCLIVMGCLVERYKEELEKALPEVDLFIKYSDYATFGEQVSQLLMQKKDNTPMQYEKRVITTGNRYAYLRIADGCSNRCTYCAIPYIRGNFKSREMEEILKEARALVARGYEELIVIAQDTTKYGVDIYGEPKLVELLAELEKIEGIRWIRFLYAYPETITPELIQLVKNSKVICHYFDIPIQHIADPVLKRMNRQSKGETIRTLVKTLRKEIPDVIIRTTVMVGFPGETQEDFEELYAFVQEAKFDKLGAFAYSKEDGTPAARIKEQVHPSTKRSRYNKIMQVQQAVSKEKMASYIGTELKVLLEGQTFDGKYYIGRSYQEVPDMDGVVYVKKEVDALEGEFVTCTIVETKEYDKIAELKPCT